MVLIPEQYVCDQLGCSATRSEVNHWVAVQAQDTEHGRIVSIYDWEYAEKRGLLSNSRHYCGSSHAIYFVSEFMGKRTPMEEQS